MAKALFSSFSFCNTANTIALLHALTSWELWPRTFAGEDAKWQPPDLADLFMHEAMESWVRRYFKKDPVSQVPCMCYVCLCRVRLSLCGVEFSQWVQLMEQLDTDWPVGI